MQPAEFGWLRQASARPFGYADRLACSTKDVLLLELAVEKACEDGDEAGGEAIVFGLKRLSAEICDLKEMVLPPLREGKESG
jgi:hypothetical protein